MQPRIEWTEMRWDFGTQAAWWPLVIERLRGTPARCAATIEGLSQHSLTTRDGESWSVLEHVGHLAEIEPLWMGRLDDFEAGLETLRPADMSNAKTWAAGINSVPVAGVLASQCEARSTLVHRLEHWGDTERWEMVAQHPRLNRPMRVIDLAVFVADHDDFHLARIDDMKRAMK